MNESKSNVANMYQTIPAVAALNRVPGFEPMKLLRKAKSKKTNETVLKLALPYKKLWFRLANPKGIIRLKPLSLTERIAVYEAQVFLDRSDNVPISMFTASSSWSDTDHNDYVKEAQEAAIDEALSMAGFGLQFVDVGMTKEAEKYGSEIPIQKVVQMPIQPQAPKQPKQQAVIKEEALPVQPVVEEALPIQSVTAAPMEVTEKEEQTLPVSNTLEQVKPTGEATSATQKALQILQGKSSADAAKDREAAPAVLPVEQAKYKEEITPTYTKETPVPEILKVMTLEDAKNVVVDFGICTGMTMKEVADNRAANLKFYLFGGYKGGNNILLAAAQIMYDYVEAKKAG